MLLRKDFNIVRTVNDDFYVRYSQGFERARHTQSYSGRTCKNIRRRKKNRRGVPFIISGLLVCVFTIGSFSVCGDFLCRHLPVLPVVSSESYQSECGLIQDSTQTHNPEQGGQEEDWPLILVNRDHPLPQTYSVETTTLDNGEQIDTRIYPALQQMFDDMRADGVYAIVASGYRTEEEQQQIMEEKIQAYRVQGLSEKEAKRKAEQWVAIPGTSEHQTGLAVDINGDGIYSEGYEVYDWLLRHAHEYGFIKRYPEDKIAITGVADEPWHYRYVGESVAAEMVGRNLCLEEYLY